MHQFHKFILSWNYMFWTVPLSIVRSLFTVHSAMVSTQLLSRSICSCSKAVYKPVWHVPLLSVQWINCRWWTDELSETCRVSWQNKFVKLVHLFGCITKKFVTMHGHMNVKFCRHFSLLSIKTCLLLTITENEINQGAINFTDCSFCDHNK